MNSEPPLSAPAGDDDPAVDGAVATDVIDNDVEVVPYRGETRRPVPLWDRIKLLLLMAVVWGALLWASLSNNPLLSVHDAVVQQLRAKLWLEVLFGLELVRQVHYLVCEHVSWWYRFWTKGVVGRISARFGRLSDWSRYRLGRITSIVIVVAAVAVVAGAAWHLTPIDALFASAQQAVQGVAVRLPDPGCLAAGGRAVRGHLLVPVTRWHGCLLS